MFASKTLWHGGFLDGILEWNPSELPAAPTVRDFGSEGALGTAWLGGTTWGPWGHSLPRADSDGGLSSGKLQQC